MSQIIVARSLIHSVILHCDIDRAAKLRLGKALSLMHRRPYCQRTRGKHQKITAAMRARMFALKGKYNIHTIANIVGVRNSARVSEILNPPPSRKKRLRRK